MLQLAIPIEPGNSGGPLLDRQGRVIGIPTLKSTVSDNIGFAMPVNALKLLLDKPNPIPLERWMTVGQLSPRKWKPLQQGARWRQRAGTVSVTGKGEGFGGRALCLYQQDPPPVPYEVAVNVKLDDESGAAGLAIASDGGDKHYGFYPSNGSIRLTHFNGPAVFSWNILADAPSKAYRPGEWNHLRLRVEAEKLIGYVNGELFAEIEHEALRGGKVGLCKFRQTEASYKGFSLGADLGEAFKQPDPEKVAALTDAIDSLLESDSASAARETLEETPQLGHRLLRKRAQQLEQQAKDLKDLAKEVHHESARQALATLLDNTKDNEIDLFHAGLLIAWLANPELDVNAYREEIDVMANEVKNRLETEATDEEKLAALTTYLFEELGFHGSRLDYYSRENSYLNMVLEDREGIPITLSVLYIELAHRIGVAAVYGAPLPGHFMVQYRPENPDKLQIIDAFERGQHVTREEANTMVENMTGGPMIDAYLKPASKRDILVRMLRNLIGIELDSKNSTAALPYLDLLLTISPEEGQERLSRALLRYQNNQLAKAALDIEWILENQPPGVRLDRIEELRDQINARIR